MALGTCHALGWPHPCQPGDRQPEPLEAEFAPAADRHRLLTRALDVQHCLLALDRLNRRQEFSPLTSRLMADVPNPSAPPSAHLE